MVIVSVFIQSIIKKYVLNEDPVQVIGRKPLETVLPLEIVENKDPWPKDCKVKKNRDDHTALSQIPDRCRIIKKECKRNPRHGQQNLNDVSD
jgi:hypothetical protein